MASFFFFTTASSSPSWTMAPSHFRGGGTSVASTFASFAFEHIFLLFSPALSAERPKLSLALAPELTQSLFPERQGRSRNFDYALGDWFNEHA
jgi:hypothetical protein